MTVPPINSNSGAGATGQSSAASNPLQSLQNPNTFLNLLVAQLKYQDPLNPTSGTQFLSQTAQLTEVEAMTQLQQEVSQEVLRENQEVSSQQQQASHLHDRPDDQRHSCRRDDRVGRRPGGVARDLRRSDAQRQRDIGAPW